MRMIWIVSLGGIYLSMTAEKIFIYASSKHKFKEEATTARWRSGGAFACGFYEMRERCRGDLFGGASERARARGPMMERNNCESRVSRDKSPHCECCVSRSEKCVMHDALPRSMNQK
jgi:hypothetical protein